MLTDPKFFKKENNTQNAAEFKRCLPVNVNTSFVTLAPAIATAEQNHVRPLMGDTLFNELATYYSENGIEGSSAEKNELVSYVQMAVVRLAYWESFDQLAVTMSDRGLQVTNGEPRLPLPRGSAETVSPTPRIRLPQYSHWLYYGAYRHLW